MNCKQLHAMEISEKFWRSKKSSNYFGRKLSLPSSARKFTLFVSPARIQLVLSPMKTLRMVLQCLRDKPFAKVGSFSMMVQCPGITTTSNWSIWLMELKFSNSQSSLSPHHTTEQSSPSITRALMKSGPMKVNGFFRIAIKPSAQWFGVRLKLVSPPKIVRGHDSLHNRYSFFLYFRTDGEGIQRNIWICWCTITSLLWFIKTISINIRGSFAPCKEIAFCKFRVNDDLSFFLLVEFHSLTFDFNRNTIGVINWTFTKSIFQW